MIDYRRLFDSYITGSTHLVDAGWTAIDGPPTGLTRTGA